MKQVIIITIPLVSYHGELYWCLYDQYTGKIREDLLNRPTGGKQIPYAFEQVLKSEGDILILADDKFSFEKNNQKIIPSEEQIGVFIKEHPLPKFWLESLGGDSMSRVVIPPKKLKCSEYSFSENFLYQRSDRTLDGECANEWLHLLEYLEEKGYEKISAYIPQVCHNGVCYATPYAQECGVLTKPVTIHFTKKNHTLLSINY